NIPPATIEGGKALATEEWLDPVTNGFNRPDVTNVERMEFVGQPIGGGYELTIHLTPDVNVERIERIQVLAQTAYWERESLDGPPPPAMSTAAGLQTPGDVSGL